MAQANARIMNVKPPTGDPGYPNVVNPWGLSNIFDPSMMKRIERYVHLYTVSRQDFTVHRAPLIPTLIIPACGPSDRYIHVASLPDPFIQVDRDPLNGDIRFHDRGASHDGCRVAMDICNPNNYSLDQDAYRKRPRGSRDLSLGVGDNLSQRGVFWSLENPPKEEEIRAAEERLEAFYRQIFDEAQALAASNPAQLHEYLSIHGKECHLAAEHFGAETTWHKAMGGKAKCPVCGQEISPGAAYHMNSEIRKICVIDPDRAYQSGAISEAMHRNLMKARGQWTEPDSPQPPAEEEN